MTAAHALNLCTLIANDFIIPANSGMMVLLSVSIVVVMAAYTASICPLA
jgi:hypothetical protein